MKNTTSVHPAFLFVILSCLQTSFLLHTLAQNKQNPGSIFDIRLIEGSWKAVLADRSIDAVWSAPMGENMVGHVRVVRNGQVSLYELFAFENTDQGLVALVRHFTPGLIAREEKD